MFDVQKHQLNCFRLSYVQMIAQTIGTVIHVPILKIMLDTFPANPITSIGIATSVSSLLKLIVILTIGFAYSDVRKAYISPCRNFFSSPTSNSTSSFMSIGFPSMVMFCAEGWAF